MKLTGKTMIALLAGAAVGLLCNLFAPNLFESLDMYLFTPLGQIFLNLISMLVVPIVFLSIVLRTAGLGDPKKLGRIVMKAISHFLITTCIAIILGLFTASIVKPREAGE